MTYAQFEDKLLAASCSTQPDEIRFLYKGKLLHSRDVVYFSKQNRVIVDLTEKDPDKESPTTKEA